MTTFPGTTARPAAFSLLEVMIAMAIFFVAIFAILQLTSQNISAARQLQRPQVSPASLAAEYWVTNQVEEGVETGDFGDVYPGFSWTREVFEVGTNGLFQVDVVVQGQRDGKRVESSMSTLFFRPDSVGALGAIRGRRR